MLNYHETERSFLFDNVQIHRIIKLSLCIEIQSVSISKSKDYYQCHCNHLRVVQQSYSEYVTFCVLTTSLTI